MNKLIMAASIAAACGPQRPLLKPSFGFGALTQRPLTMHDPDQGGAFSSAVAKALESETDPDKALVASIKASAKKGDEIASNVDQLGKDTKRALEDYTKAKNEVDGLSATVKQFEQTLRRFQLQLAREKSAAFGNPVQRIAGDPEMRMLLNALVRQPIYKKAGRELPECFAKALGEGATPGSTYLRSELAVNIYDLLASYGIWMTLGVEPVGTLTKVYPVQTADPICLVIAEGDAASDDTNIAGTSVSATVKKLMTLLRVSNELLADSEYDVTARILPAFARATALRADHMAFVADGDADTTDGSATGVFQFGTLVTAATGNTTMEALELEDITSVLLNAPVELLTKVARWWLHPYILIRLLHIKDTNGRPLFLTALEAPTAGGIGSILGYPVTKGNICPSTNSAGARVLAFGDGEGFAVGVRQDLQIAASEHIRFDNDQVAWRAIARMAFKGKLATAFQILRTATS